jgi:creatinine amidohydrolase
MSEEQRSCLLEHMTWPEFQAAVGQGRSVLVPAGSVEQHGPHLPLGTDALIADGLARRVAAKTGCIVAPGLRYGAYSHPRSGGGDRTFPGSTGMRGGTLQDVVEDVAEDLFGDGFRCVVVLNGHFENAPFLFEGLQAVVGHEIGSRKALLINYWEQIVDDDLPTLFPNGFPGWEAEHAGVVETSLMEVLHPKLVDPSQKGPGGAERMLTYDVFPTPPEAVPASGVGWDARPASPEIGRYLADVLVSRLVEILVREGVARADG